MASLKHSKSGQTVIVPDGAVDYYTSKGWVVAGAAAAEPVTDFEGAPSKDWKNDQIVAYAQREGIDLGDATKKNDMLAVIAAAAEPVE